jgi:hypothetical protein
VSARLGLHLPATSTLGLTPQEPTTNASRRSSSGHHRGDGDYPSRTGQAAWNSSSTAEHDCEGQARSDRRYCALTVEGIRYYSRALVEPSNGGGPLGGPKDCEPVRAQGYSQKGRLDSKSQTRFLGRQADDPAVSVGTDFDQSGSWVSLTTWYDAVAIPTRAMLAKSPKDR